MDSNDTDVTILAPSQASSEPQTAKAGELTPGTRIVDPLNGRAILAVEHVVERNYPHGPRATISARNESTHTVTTRTLHVATPVELAP